MVATLPNDKKIFIRGYCQSGLLCTGCKGYRIPGQKSGQTGTIKNSHANHAGTERILFTEVMVGKEDNVFPMVPQGCSVSEIRLNNIDAERIKSQQYE